MRLVLLAAVLAVACADTVTSVRGDAGAPDAVPPDAPGLGVGLCGAAGMIDANVDGVARGRVTSVFFDASQLTAGAALPSSAGCGGRGDGAFRLVMRYTPRARANLRLRVETIAPAGAPVRDGLPDRVVLLDGCAASARRLACWGVPDDEVNLIGTFSRFGSVEPVAAGVPLYIVASLATARAGVVEIAEVPDVVPVGAACEHRGQANVCAPGASCTDQAVPRCMPDGSPYAACRRGGAPCDGDLTCVGATPAGLAGRCIPMIAPGAPCDGAGRCLSLVCDEVTDARGRCVAMGAARAPCRSASPACDPGLACRVVQGGFSQCLPAVVTGGLCRNAPAEPSCLSGERCGDGAGGGTEVVQRCVRPAVEEGACVEGGAPCAPGLVCSDGRCRAPVPAGEPCAVGASAGCALGASCVTSAGASGQSACALDGAPDAPCRRRAPACDAGLACEQGICRTAVAPGAECASAFGPQRACSGGARCDGTCRVEGADGGWCRPSSPSCDPGLTCFARGASVVCVATVRVGGRCGDPRGGPDAVPAAVCEGGAACVYFPGESLSRCVARENASRTCAAGAACPAGARCVLGLCVPEIPVGAPCVAGEVCAAGAHCLHRDGEVDRCDADGGALALCRETGAACDPGLVCSETLLGSTRARFCLEAVAPGGDCTEVPPRACAEGSVCVRGVCASSGAVGGPCRDAGAPCDRGLTCDGYACRPTIADGGRCDASASGACAEGSACAANAAGAFCVAPSYAVEVRSGVAFEDPCAAPVAEFAPFSFTLLGAELAATLRPSGAIALVERASRNPARLTLNPWYGVGGDDVGAGCARVFGTAPSRRLVMGGGLGSTRVADGGVSWEVVFFEGTSAIELRYSGGPRPSEQPAPPRAYPRIAYNERAIAAYAVPTAAGSAVRFTPW